MCDENNTVTTEQVDGVGRFPARIHSAVYSTDTHCSRSTGRFSLNLWIETGCGSWNLCLQVFSLDDRWFWMWQSTCDAGVVWTLLTREICYTLQRLIEYNRAQFMWWQELRIKTHVQTDDTAHIFHTTRPYAPQVNIQSFFSVISLSDSMKYSHATISRKLVSLFGWKIVDRILSVNII